MLLLIFLSPGGFASAQSIHSIKPGADKSGPLSDLRDMGTGVVTSVVDPLTVVLADKRIIHLASVDLPIYPGEKENAFATLALQRMQSLYLGQKITFYQTRGEDKGRLNALGQNLGHIVKREGDKQIWAQKVLLEEGLVRALPTISNPEAATALREAEIVARKTQKGLWRSAPWTVKDPTTVSAYLGTIQVVQGKVHSVATRNNVTYINFDRDWKTDFTIEVDAAMRRQLMRAKLNPMALTGKYVEVRGFVENHNGPAIQLESPQLLQIVEARKPEAPVAEEPKLEQGVERITVEPIPMLPKDTGKEDTKPKKPRRDPKTYEPNT